MNEYDEAIKDYGCKYNRGVVCSLENKRCLDCGFYPEVEHRRKMELRGEYATTLLIKECPCCGYTAAVEVNKERKGYVADVHCNSCLLSMRSIPFDTERAAIFAAVAAWNTRTRKDGAANECK